MDLTDTIILIQMMMINVFRTDTDLVSSSLFDSVLVTQHKTQTTSVLLSNHKVGFERIQLNREVMLKKELKQLELQLRKYPNRTDIKLAMLKINNEIRKIKKK